MLTHIIETEIIPFCGESIQINPFLYRYPQRKPHDKLVDYSVGGFSVCIGEIFLYKAVHLVELIVLVFKSFHKFVKGMDDLSGTSSS